MSTAFLPKGMEKGGICSKSFDCIFERGDTNILRVPRVPLLPSSESKANVGCYEYHFLTKGIDKSCFLVVQVVLVRKKMYERNRPLKVQTNSKATEAKQEKTAKKEITLLKII